MTPFPWDSKDISGATDDKDSNLDPNLSGPSPETTRLGEWSTSRRELWCFYLYYVVRFLFFGGVVSFINRPKGNNGLSGFNFGPSQFQNLLYLAGYDPSQPPFTKPCGSGTNCVLPYMGHVRNSLSHSCTPHRSRPVLLMNLPPIFFLLCVVNSIVLLTNGISFAIQAVLLLVIGAWADYGTWRCAGAESSTGAEWILANPKQAEYLDFFYHSAGGRLVCMAWRPRPITMASRRRIVYPRP